MTQIVDYELFEIPPFWLFLRLETSNGLVGWGESTLEGSTKPVIAAVEQLMNRHVLGSDSERIEDTWQVMYRGGFYRGGPILMSAIAGIDQALWDIKGKRYGTPVYNLLGGRVRDRVRTYDWIAGDRYKHDAGSVGDAARELVEDGFTALKMYATSRLNRIDTPAKVHAAAERLEEVRDAVGPNIDVCVDFHGRVTKSMAPRLIDAFEPYEPMFVEEVVLPEHTDALPEIAAQSSIPIALGERRYTRSEVRWFLDRQCVDVLQPVIAHAGGITECKKIADMAAAYDVSLAPDCSLGPIALAASLQIDFSSSNAFLQQRGPAPQERIGELVTGDASLFDCSDGYLYPPDGPGLGIELDETYLREQADKNTNWENPVWRLDDGSVVEW